MVSVLVPCMYLYTTNWSILFTVDKPLMQIGYYTLYGDNKINHSHSTAIAIIAIGLVLKSGVVLRNLIWGQYIKFI